MGMLLTPDSVLDRAATIQEEVWTKKTTDTIARERLVVLNI